ncbi:MAG: YfiR family protein [Caulobacteraceae bacterium]
MALWLALAGGASADSGSLEYAVKANYLYKFAPFVEWPDRAFPSATSPFNICVVGLDPFGKGLDDAVQGQRVGDRPISVHRAAVAEPGMNCQILFASKSTAQSAADTMRAVAGEPVLTVTDQSRGVSGGMIQFVMREGRVKFEIDAAAAEASGLQISSKLLGLATSLRR